MEYSETQTDVKALNELNTDDSEDSLEKLDDEQFIRFLENNYNGLQKSHEDLDNEWIQQGQENSILWEKSFEHSILLEVDDFNLNFTEVHDSYTICLSQSSTEDANVDITTDDISNIESEHSFDDGKVSSINERQYDYNQDIQHPSNSDKYSEPKGSLMQNLECIFSENRVQDVPDNSTDEEQEELPYDGNLQITNQNPADTLAYLDDHRAPLTIGKSRQNDGPDRGMARILAKNEQSNVEIALFQKEMTYTRMSPETEDSGKNKIGATNLTSEDNGNAIVSEHEMKLEHNKRRRSNIAESLLRHFSEEDLALSSTKYIDTETLPETSFTETIEETIIKKQILSAASNNSPTDMLEFAALQADLSKQRKVHEFTNENKMSKDYSYCDRSAQRQATDLLQTNNNNCRENPHCEMQEENEKLQFNPKTASRLFEKFKIGKIISYNEIKYGKGQQLYPLPDFSKVAPKIKIPKTSSSNKYIPSRIKKAKSSSNLSYPLTSHTSTVDIVQNVLDSLQPRTISSNTAFNKQEFLKDNHSPELFQQLQEEFDKLLIKYAEAENTIDQLRFGAKVSILTDSTKPNQIIHSGMNTLPCQITTLAKQGQLGLSSDLVFLGSVCNNTPTPLSIDYGVITSASCSPNTEMNETTEAEQMAQKLNKHIEYFKHQVKEFEENLNSNTISVEDQQKVFKQMRDDQDQLERSYIIAKEEHRSLQQRHYLEKNTAIGEFDPDREIEGDIFRLGMHLESVKDKLDDNICNQPSPYNSFSTSTPLPPPEILSAGYALYSESPMAAINQEGVKLIFESSSVSAEIPDSIEFRMIPEMDSQPSLLEHSYDHILHQDLYKHPNTLAHALDLSMSESTLNNPCWMQIKKGEGCRTISGPVANIDKKQTEWDPKLVPHIEHSKTMSTLTEGYFHSSEFFPALPRNHTLSLPNTSSQALDLLTEYKQQILSPDSGFVGSESCRPLTSKQILDSEQPETERSPNIWEGTPTIERQKSSSSHRSESMIGIGDKASCLLHLAKPSSCSFPFNCVVGETDIPAQQGKSVLDVDLHHESSEDLMPLPTLQQCTPKITPWNIASSTEESQNLSQKWAIANDKIMILQNEVLKLKQKLEESLSKLSKESTRKKGLETALGEQRYKNTPHLDNKCSSTSTNREDVRLPSTNSKHHRRFCQRADDFDDISDIELNTCHHNVTLSTAQSQFAGYDEYIQPCHLCIERKIHLPSFSRNGPKLCKKRMNPSLPCRKNIHCKHFSERSSQHSKDGFSSSVRISPPGANKYTDLPTNILPIRYDSTKCPPNARDSRMYNSSSCKMVKKPEQIARTKSLLISNIDKNIENSQVSNLNETLDRAIETAKHMKKTTRRMVKVLSADLATAEYYKYLYDF